MRNLNTLTKKSKKKKTLKVTCSNCKKDWHIKEKMSKKIPFADSMWRCRMCGAYNYF